MVNKNIFSHFASVRFSSATKAYFFGTNNKDIKNGDVVLVNTIRGDEIGIVCSDLIPISKNKSTLELKPILGLATKEEIEAYKKNQTKSQEALIFVNQQIEELNLNMRVICCEFLLDGTKLMITYLSEERVDFRKLLIVLASKFKTRIDLKQIGSRDKAKAIGGIGICGLPICCSYFLNSFDGISINRAKNQMLALNIPKLSGHCGKLICCLLYEDEAYTEMKNSLPKVGYRFKMNDENYKITGINVLTKVIKIESSSEIKFVDYADIRKYIKNEK